MIIFYCIITLNFEIYFLVRATMSKLFSFWYNSSSLRFGPMPWQFQNMMFVPMKANIRYLHCICHERWLTGRSYLEGLGCLGTTLFAELGGLRDLRMADGLMTLVGDVNLNEVSPLAREVLGLEAEGADVDLQHQTG